MKSWKNKFEARNYSLTYSYCLEKPKIENGSIIMHNVVINSNARIGKNCIINTGAIIEHDVIIEHTYCTWCNNKWWC